MTPSAPPGYAYAFTKVVSWCM